ncbi:hypothetical protein IJG76_00455 [Candidatus Saccharibacteria bacterium]|nr:hypothetical protein [Candidatus Saccharibacteria bacterium]
MNENPNENPFPTDNPAPAEFPSAGAEAAPAEPAPVASEAPVEPAPVAPETPEPAPVAPQTFGAPAEPQSFGATPAETPISVGAPKKNNKLILIIIAAVVLLAGIGVALYFILKPKDNPKPSQQSKSDYSLFENLATSLNDTFAVDVDDSGNSTFKFVGGSSAITGMKLAVAYDAMNVSLDSVLANDGNLYLKVSGLSAFSALVPGLSKIDGSWIVLSSEELKTISESMSSSISVLPTSNCGGSLSLEESLSMITEIEKIAKNNFPLSLTSTSSTELTGTVYRVNIDSKKLVDLLIALANNESIQKLSKNCTEPVVVDCVSTSDDEYVTDCVSAANTTSVDFSVLDKLTDEDRAELVKYFDEAMAKIPPILISVDDNFRLTGIFVAGEVPGDYGTQKFSLKLNLSYGSVSAPTSSALTLTELFASLSE